MNICWHEHFWTSFDFVEHPINLYIFCFHIGTIGTMTRPRPIKTMLMRRFFSIVITLLYPCRAIDTTKFTRVDSSGSAALLKNQAEFAGLLLYDDGTVCDPHRTFNTSAADAVCGELGFGEHLEFDHVGNAKWKVEKNYRASLANVSCAEGGSWPADCQSVSSRQFTRSGQSGDLYECVSGSGDHGLILSCQDKVPTMTTPSTPSSQTTSSATIPAGTTPETPNTYPEISTNHTEAARTTSYSSSSATSPTERILKTTEKYPLIIKYSEGTTTRIISRSYASTATSSSTTSSITETPHEMKGKRETPNEIKGTSSTPSKGSPTTSPTSKILETTKGFLGTTDHSEKFTTTTKSTSSKTTMVPREVTPQFYEKDPDIFVLRATCDNVMSVFVDGTEQKPDINLKNEIYPWQIEKVFHIPKSSEVIGIKCMDEGQQEGILASLEDTGGITRLFTNSSWQCASVEQAGWSEPGFAVDPELWGDAEEGGKHGVKPWGLIGNISREASWIWAEERLSTAYCRVNIHFRAGREIGEPGEKGEPGEPGATGKTGATGEPGLIATCNDLCTEKGERGEPGVPGLKGEQGKPGDPGQVGDPGEVGEEGMVGSPGDPGSVGEPGSSGDAGSDGTPGTPGMCDVGAGSCLRKLGKCYGVTSIGRVVKCRDGYAATSVWKNTRFWGLRCCEVLNA